MNHPQLVEIGTIQRTHGVNGELQVSWVNDFYPEQQKLESVFIEIDGIPIPFFITSLRSKGGTSALIKLDDFDSINDVNEFIGSKLFAEVTLLKDDEEMYLDDLVGYSLINQKGILIGEIKSLEDFSGNAVFNVTHPSGKEIIVPASPDLIHEITEETRTISMEIPEGLIELYLE